MGLGSVLTLQGNNYSYNASDEPDALAIAHDWSVVGQDLRQAIQLAPRAVPAQAGQSVRS